MRKIFISILLVSGLTYAGCGDDFNNAAIEFDFAGRYFDIGVDSYNKAVENSQSDNPNITKICNHLVDSVGGFTVARSSYNNCQSHFSKAVKSCSGADSLRAKEYMKICQQNRDTAQRNLNAIRNSLQSTCFKGEEFLESDIYLID